MGPPPMSQPYGGSGPIIVMQQQQQQQQQQAPQSNQTVIVQHSGVNHALCAVICLITGGLSLPCWIIACLTE
jgi:hypothetical protein